MNTPRREEAESAKKGCRIRSHARSLVSIACTLVLFAAPPRTWPAPKAPAANPGPRETPVREVKDPCLGYRWQWIVDTAHLDRPSRLVLVGERDPGRPSRLQRVEEIPVIRSGDRVTVFQQSKSLTGQFQAVALESAHVGQTFALRLTFTSDRSRGANFVLTSQGQVIHAAATGDGTAVWTPDRTTTQPAANWSAQ